MYLRKVYNYFCWTPNHQKTKKVETTTKLIGYIEHPETTEKAREEALTELNLLGVPAAHIEDAAYTYWQNYFTEHMDTVLKHRIVIVSHLLADDLLNQCFHDIFQEYQDRKKQLGIDDVRRFWAP